MRFLVPLKLVCHCHTVFMITQIYLLTLKVGSQSSTWWWSQTIKKWMGLVNRPKALLCISRSPLMSCISLGCIEHRFHVFLRGSYDHTNRRNICDRKLVSTDRNCASGMICHRLIGNLEKVEKCKCKWTKRSKVWPCVLLSGSVLNNKCCFLHHCLILHYDHHQFILRTIQSVVGSGVEEKRRYEHDDTWDAKIIMGDDD